MKKHYIKIGATIAVSALMIAFVPIIRNHANSSSTETENLFNIYGDINGDCIIDSFDVVAMRTMISNKTINKQCDLDFSGTVDENDLKLLSDYVLGGVELYSFYLEADSDGDGLKDVDEILYTQTSPYDKYSNGMVDSNNDAILDSDADLDSDGLTNYEEIVLETNPLRDDSDRDGIKDNDEITEYDTDPTKDDSDGDGVIDGDEILLNLNPHEKYSDGKNNDGSVTTKQTINTNSKVVLGVNNDNPFDLSIDMQAAGVADNNALITNSRYYYAIPDDYLVGSPIDISYNNRIKMSSATINFTLDASYSKSVNPNNCMIFRYDTDNNCILPVKTEYRNNTLFTETNELGTYCVVNIEEYKKALDNNDLLEKPLIDDIEVAFVIDLSENLNDTLEETKESIHAMSSALFSVSETFSINIIGYYDDANVVKFNNSSLKSMDEVDVAIERLKAYSNSKNNRLDVGVKVAEELVSNGIISKECKNKYVFVIVDSDYSYRDRINNLDILLDDSNTLSPLKESFKKINENEVNLSIILSRNNYEHRYTSYLKAECNKYNYKVYSKSMFNSFAECAYEVIAKKLYMNNEIHFSNSMLPVSTPQKVNYHSFINCIPKTVERNKVPSSDIDGNINLKEALAVCDFDFPSLYSLCNNNQITEEGLKQFLDYLGSKYQLNLAVLPVISYSDSDYAVEGHKDFREVQEGYYVPPTYYEEIEPVKPVHEDGVNGRYLNGIWEDWR